MKTHIRLPLEIAAAFDQLGEGVIIADKVGKLIYVNAAAERLHGVKALDVEPEDYSQVYALLTMDGAPYPFDQLPMARAVMKGESVEDAYWRIRRPDGSEIVAVGTARPVSNEAGEQIASVLTLSDKTAELQHVQDMTKALATKETLLKELNHRVKNSLQNVISLLRLRAGRAKLAEVRSAMTDAAERIAIMADLHKTLYEGQEHETVAAKSFILRMIRNTVEAYAGDKQIQLEVSAKGEWLLPIEKAINLSLALHELVLNSLKYAFADTSYPTISLDLDFEQTPKRITYRDNGCGVTQSETHPTGDGIGALLLLGLTSSLNASLQKGDQSDGYSLTISLPA